MNMPCIYVPINARNPKAVYLYHEVMASTDTLISLIYLDVFLHLCPQLDAGYAHLCK